MAEPVGPRVVDPARAAETTTGVSVARSSAWNLASRLLPLAYIGVVSIAAARYLGPEDFGRQSFIAFIELSLVTLLVAGLATALSRFVGAALGAGEPGHVRVLGRVAAWIGGAAAVVAAAIMIAIALGGQGPQAAWIFAGIFAVTSILQIERNAVLTGFQRWREVTIAGLAVGAVSTVAVIVVLELGGGISGIFAVEAAAGALLLVWTVVLVQRALGSLEAGPVAGAPTRRMLRYTGLATLGIVLTLVVWRRSEFLFLDYYSTDTQIGFFSIAFAAAAAVLLVPLAITGVLLPSIATLHGAHELARIRSGYARAARLLLVFSLPLIAGGIALGPMLIELVYGSSYSEAGPLLVILLLPAPFVVVGNLAGTLLAATERLVVPTVIGLVAAVLNIGLCFLLIPPYDSVGAAIANAIAQLVYAVPAIVYVHARAGGGDWMAWSIGKAATASAAGGVVAWGVVMGVGGVAGFVLGLCAGCAVFVLLARLLRPLSADDAHWLDRVIGGALGGKVGSALRFCAAAPASAA